MATCRWDAGGKTFRGAAVGETELRFEKKALVSISFRAQDGRAALQALASAYGTPEQADPSVNVYTWRGESVMLTAQPSADGSAVIALVNIAYSKRKTANAFFNAFK